MECTGHVVAPKRVYASFCVYEEKKRGCPGTRGLERECFGPCCVVAEARVWMGASDLETIVAECFEGAVDIVHVVPP